MNVKKSWVPKTYALHRVHVCTYKQTHTECIHPIYRTCPQRSLDRSSSSVSPPPPLQAPPGIGGHPPQWRPLHVRHSAIRHHQLLLLLVSGRQHLPGQAQRRLLLQHWLLQQCQVLHQRCPLSTVLRTRLAWCCLRSRWC